MRIRPLLSIVVFAASCGGTATSPPTTNELVSTTSVASVSTSTSAPARTIAGLASGVSISVSDAAGQSTHSVDQTNHGEIDLFRSVAACSLVEAPHWFALEIVSYSPDSDWLRVSSSSVIGSVGRSVDGILEGHLTDVGAIDAAIRVVLDDDGRAGRFSGLSSDGEVVSGSFSCDGGVDSGVASTDDDRTEIEFSARLVMRSNGLVATRRVGLRAMNGVCDDVENPGQREVLRAEASEAVGGLTTVVGSTLDSAAVDLSLTIAGRDVTVQDAKVTAMPGGAVFSGVSPEGIEVDGAWSCSGS